MLQNSIKEILKKMRFVKKTEKTSKSSVFVAAKVPYLWRQNYNATKLFQ